jgi:hypothetical protein
MVRCLIKHRVSLSLLLFNGAVKHPLLVFTWREWGKARNILKSVGLRKTKENSAWRSSLEHLTRCKGNNIYLEVWGSYSLDYEEYYRLGYNFLYLDGINCLHLQDRWANWGKEWTVCLLSVIFLSWRWSQHVHMRVDELITRQLSVPYFTRHISLTL